MFLFYVSDFFSFSFFFFSFICHDWQSYSFQMFANIVCKKTYQISANTRTEESFICAYVYEKVVHNV